MFYKRKESSYTRVKRQLRVKTSCEEDKKQKDEFYSRLRVEKVKKTNC